MQDDGEFAAVERFLITGMSIAPRHAPPLMRIAPDLRFFAWQNSKRLQRISCLAH